MGRAKRYWVRYRQITNFPAISGSRAERNPGIILYSLCFLLALCLLVSMVLEESQTYINYGTSGGDYVRAVVHRPPDIVVCPSRQLGSGRDYELFYDEHLIKALNMTSDHINMITKMHHTTCERGTKCTELAQSCATHTLLAPVCQVLKALVAKDKGENDTVRNSQGSRERESIINKEKATVLQVAVKSGYLQMLWLAIIDSRYKDIQKRFKDLRQSRPSERQHQLILCHYYSENRRDFFRNQECAEHQESFWLGLTYCSLIRGSKIEDTSTPYIGFHENRNGLPHRYWVGNLETTTLTEKLLITNFIGHSKKQKEERKTKIGPISLVTGVGHYSMIRWTDITGKRMDCRPQPLIKGLRLPLENCKGSVASRQAVTSWYYDFKYEKRPLPVIWIYPQSIRKVEKYRSFSAYTQFQVGAGLLSCFVGFSFLQIFELLLNFIKKLKLLSKRILSCTQIASLLCALILTLTLTSLDLYWYFESRYTTIFSQRKEALDFPTVELCNDLHSRFYFINTTKMAEFNASVSFYLFMRLAGWHVAPCVNVAYKEHIVNGTLVSVEVKEWMRRNWEPKVGQNTTCGSKYNFYCFQASCPWYHLIRDHGYREKNLQAWIDQESFGKIFYDIVEKDVQEVAETIGLDDPSIAQLVEFFSLDPRQLIRCSVNGRAWDDCGRFGKYFLETGNNEYCLSLQIPSEESQKITGEITKWHSFQISYDSKAYEEHSDYSSYYGIGVEAEKERYKELSRCEGRNLNARAVLEGGYVRSICDTYRSWKLKVAQPHWAQNYIQIQHPKMGLLSRQLHTLNLQTGFTAMLPLNETRCVLDKKHTCSFPKEEATAVYKAVQYHLWCGCCYCLDEKESFLSHLEYIFGRKLSCCTPKQLLNCLEKYQSAMKWNDEKGAYMEDSNYKIASNFMYLMKPFSDVELLRKLTPANVSIWIRFGSESLSDKEATKLADWTRECFKLPCEEKSYTLLSYHNEPTEEDVVNLTIVFESTVGVGAEEIDRLDPAQLLGILLCSFSVTIGIGVVGLLEIAFVIISKIKGNTVLKLGTTIHEHLIRGLSPMTKFNSMGKIIPRESTEEECQNVSSVAKDDQMTEESLEKPSVAKKVEVGSSDDIVNKIGPTLQIVEIYDQSINEAPSQGTDKSDEKNSDRAVFHVPFVEPDIQSISEHELSQKVEKLDEENSDEAVHHVAHVEPNTQSINEHESSQKVEKGDEENSDGGVYHVFLLIFLLVSIGVAIFLIVYLLSDLETESSADIQVSPEYEKPSLAICVGSKEYAESLWAALQLSKCWSESRGPDPCSSLFTTYIHAKRDQYCYLLDNSVVTENQPAARLDSQEEDLRIEMPQGGPEAKLYVNGLNDSKAEDINAFFSWRRQNVIITYSVEAYEQESGCVYEIPTNQCAECALPEAISQSYPVECCTSAKKAPRFVPEKTCYELHYSVSYVPSKAGGGSFKSLSVRASSDFLIIYKVKSKHRILMLISISGGFISSFTEITVLNILALSGYLFWKTTTNIKNAKTVKATRNDVERNPDAKTCEEKEPKQNGEDF